MNNFSTILKDRILCYDGDSIITSKSIFYNKLMLGESLDGLFVLEIDEEIDNYNKFVDKTISTKSENNVLPKEWNIPDKYKNIQVRSHILLCLKDEIDDNDFTDLEIETRLNRIDYELKLWKDRDLLDLLRTLIYIVDQFRANDIVWGTGRGSSCCCYILYLIGIHDVDSIKYNLDLSEFFKE